MITIYHKGYDPQTRADTWTRHTYTGETVYINSKVSVDSSGLSRANVYKIRIFTDDAVIVATGDKVVSGECRDARPPKDCWTVIGYSDNRKPQLPQNVWHWRVDCV